MTSDFNKLSVNFFVSKMKGAVVNLLFIAVAVRRRSIGLAKVYLNGQKACNSKNDNALITDLSWFHIYVLMLTSLIWIVDYKFCSNNIILEYFIFELGRKKFLPIEDLLL